MSQENLHNETSGQAWSPERLMCVAWRGVRGVEDLHLMEEGRPSC